MFASNSLPSPVKAHIYARLTFATALLDIAFVSLWIGFDAERQIAYAQGSIIGVKTFNSADPGNDGSTWDSAYVKLQDAITAANSGAQIWVAKGIYYLDEVWAKRITRSVKDLL